MLRAIVVSGLVVALIVGAFGALYRDYARRQYLALVAKECIEHGGRYHETWFRHRPVCK